uniref:Uncharacterized protein n=1 Tax=Octopus bimaculoides TaxID=37653 RepID=A0A0L8FVL5_OCTBM
MKVTFIKCTTNAPQFSYRVFAFPVLINNLCNIALPHFYIICNLMMCHRDVFMNHYNFGLFLFTVNFATNITKSSLKKKIPIVT